MEICAAFSSKDWNLRWKSCDQHCDPAGRFRADVRAEICEVRRGVVLTSRLHGFLIARNSQLHPVLCRINFGETMRTVSRFAALLIGLGGFTAFAATDDGFVDLFNGKDIDGWIQRGGKAKYAAENGELVGTAVADTPNSFLCPPKDYSDFVLEYDFKVDPKLNSGVQIRSHAYDHETEIEFQGKKIKVAANRVHGYQLEIDNDTGRKRFWSAGIYEEGRRSWLCPGALGGDGTKFTEQGKKLTKVDDWNHVKVEAIGSHIKTWFNGEERAEITDSVDASGFFGFQVHGIGKEKDKIGIQVRFKNIRIKEITGAKGAAGEAGAAGQPGANTLTDDEKKDGWKLLWDGKSGDGWVSLKTGEFPDHGWSMKDGVLTVNGTDGSQQRGGGDIVTKEKFKSFTLKFDFKITKGANSGVKYFVDLALSKKGPGMGLEYQILDDENHPDAKLGSGGDRTISSLYDLIPASKDKKPSPIGEWNHGMIVVNGAHCEHWLNGMKVVEYERGSEDFRKHVAASKWSKLDHFGEVPEGPILLQDHGNTVSFQNIKIKVQ
jgi:hypothetical protein